MKKLVNLENVISLDNLIRTGVTGKPDELAKKLKMSRSNFFDTLSFLREEMCAPIEYDEQTKMYKYTFIPKFFLSDEVKNVLFAESEANVLNKNDNPDIFDSEEYDMDDEALDEKLKSTELIEVYGGLKKEDWITDSLNDDLDNVILDIDISFNDFSLDSF